MRTLVAVDGSELAQQAARRAVTLLGPAIDEITLVEVVQPIEPAVMSPVGAMAPVAAMDVEGDRIEESNRAMIQEAEGELAATARNLGLEAETRVLVGDPGRELCRFAAEGSYDVLVVGSHGSGFLKRMLLGSVSHHVLHHAPCPVLVVRAGEGEPARA